MTGGARESRPESRRIRLRPGALAAVACVALLLFGCTPSQPAGPHPSTPGRQHSTRPTPAPSDSPPPVPLTLPGVNAWLGYHADHGRTGAAATPPGVSFSPIRTAWTDDLGGAVYGQPVVADGRVIAATENNRVVALDPAGGQVIWSATIGRPLTDVQSAAGCGDIDPLGVTSTPVVDIGKGTVYVVAEVSDGNGTVHHQLEGLSVATGRVLLSERIDPPLPGGERAVQLLQRASLALANGRVYVSYGGNFGDCGDYHGWVVGVSESGPPRMVTFESAPDGHGGAIWQGGGAPAVDARGDLYVATGNANPDPPEGGPDPVTYAESVVQLSPDLHPVAAFKDARAGGDEDFGTGNPVLLPGGRVFAVGKTNIGYVLRQGDLGQQAAIHGICGSDPDGGPAYDAATNSVFVPCRDGGIQQVDLTRNTVVRRLHGANSAPILIGSTVWAAQYPDGRLSQFDIASGRLLQQIDVGSSVPHFVSPSTALGRIFLGTDSGVAAFSG